MAIPSIAIIPSGYKANKVYSVLPTDGSGDLDFARTTKATRVNSEGLIEEVAIGVPRLDYTDGGCPSLLLEPSSTNLIPISEDVSSWSLTNAIATPNSIISPDGTLNATKIVTNSNGVDVKLTSISVLPSTVYTCSFYCNFVGGTGLQGRFYDNTNGTNIEYYNYDSQLIAGEWSRVTRTFTTPVGCTNIQVWLIATSSTNPVTAYYWGAQLEQKSSATSYIPTAGTTISRTADSASKSGISSLLGQTEGTLFAEFSAVALASGVNWVNISDNTSSNWIFIGKDGGKVRAYIKANGVVHLDNSATNLTSSNKVALTYKSGDYALYINGVLIISGTSSFSFSSALDTLAFSNYNGGAIAVKTSYNQVQAYNTRLSNSELQTLTTL